jgi:hypothetical protein
VGTALAGFVAFALAVGAGKQLALSRAARRRDQLLRTLEELGGREEAQLVQVH